MAEPPFNGEGEEERYACDGTACDEERFENVRADVGDVGDAPLHGGVLGPPARKPCYEHRPERSCKQRNAFDDDMG